jgi:uncharacterized protein
MPRKAWWSKGIRFECQGSGRCCVSRGKYGFVYLTLGDRRRFSKYFKMPLREFTRTYCQQTDGQTHLRESSERVNCIFLEGNRCSVYAARPTQCRTWPFWPENLSPKAWEREVVSFCPGVGKGRVRNESEILKNVRQQESADKTV